MSKNQPEEQLIAEAITPAPGTMDVGGMTRGEPGLPLRFIWRGREYAVAATLARWKDTGPCRSGSAERYVRRHWFEVRTQDGWTMKIYFDRQARSGRERLRRWWLHTATPPPRA